MAIVKELFWRQAQIKNEWIPSRSPWWLGQFRPTSAKERPFKLFANITKLSCPQYGPSFWDKAELPPIHQITIQMVYFLNDRSQTLG